MFCDIYCCDLRVSSPGCACVQPGERLAETAVVFSPLDKGLEILTPGLGDTPLSPELVPGRLFSAPLPLPI